MDEMLDQHAPVVFRQPGERRVERFDSSVRRPLGGRRRFALVPLARPPAPHHVERRVKRHAVEPWFEIPRGPNIQPPPEAPELPDSLEGTVTIVVEDDV